MAEIFDKFNDDDYNGGINEGTKDNIIHISILLRGRKKLTLIHGLKEIYDFKKILKYWRKMYSCNGSVFLDKKIGKMVIKISGDHREDVAKFFYEEGIAEHENIKIHGA